MNAHDIQELNALSHLLAGGLATAPETVSGVPLEVIQALAEARDQMTSLPEVIDHLSQAFVRFNTVSAALARMVELADRTSGATSESDRETCNEEFIGLAKIVAADAGRHYYTGPSLNLKNEGEARSAARILRYLGPVIETMRRELMEQKDLVHEVIAETIKFLGIITECYPESAGAAHLGQLLNEARTRNLTISTPGGLLH